MARMAQSMILPPLLPQPKPSQHQHLNVLSGQKEEIFKIRQTMVALLILCPPGQKLDPCLPEVATKEALKGTATVPHGIQESFVPLIMGGTIDLS